MNFLKQSLKAVIAAFFTVLMTSQILLAFDGPLAPNGEEGGEEGWAPAQIMRLHPVYFQLVVLEKIEETEERAYYKVAEGTSPPQNGMCSTHPDLCILDRPPEE